MLVLVDLFEFEVIIAPELSITSSHRIGGFQQVVAVITVAGFNHPGMLCLKFTRLVLCPDKAAYLATEARNGRRKNLCKIQHRQKRGIKAVAKPLPAYLEV